MVTHQPHRLRRCKSRLSASAPGILAVVLFGCTPLTGLQKFEEGKAPASAADAGDARSDADARRGRVQTDDPDAGKSSVDGVGGGGGAAAPRDASGAGRRSGDGDASQRERMDMQQAAGSDASAAGSGGSESSASDMTDVTCVPVFVQEARGQFVQVRCQSAIMLGGDSVEYLAMPTKALPAACTRFSELASAALLRASAIGVRVSAAGRGNDSGCEAARCRTIRAFSQGM